MVDLFGEDPNPELVAPYEDQRPEDIFEALNPGRRVIKCPICSSPETVIRCVEFPSAGLYMEMDDNFVKWEVRPMLSGPDNSGDEEEIRLIVECRRYLDPAAKHRWVRRLRVEVTVSDDMFQTEEIEILS